MRYDLGIANATVVLPTGKAKLDIGIIAGRIALLGDSGTVRADEIIDAAGLTALPGAIDMHVHFRDPGATHKEDFVHGTAAAACGGVTTVCDMPNTKPSVVSARDYALKLSTISGSAHVDYGLWAGGTAIDEFAEMRDLGAVGLKVYMNRAPAGSQSYTSELSMPDDETFIEVLRKTAELQWCVSVHVQSPDIDEALKRTMRVGGRRDPRDVCEMTRSPESAEAQARLLRFAEITRARVHIAHISFNSIEALNDFEVARGNGSMATAEVVPPCLSFDDLKRQGTFGIPFAHSNDHIECYWDALRNGVIDVVATDHAPHTLSEKMKGEHDAWDAPSGYPGVETMLPLLIDATLRNKLSFERLAQVTSENPAKICGFARKGVIALGKDADIVLIDPAQEWIVDQRQLHSKAGWSPFHGRRLRGRICNVLLRGNEISRNGELLSSIQNGQNVIPSGDNRPVVR